MNNQNKGMLINDLKIINRKFIRAFQFYEIKRHKLIQEIDNLVSSENPEIHLIVKLRKRLSRATKAFEIAGMKLQPFVEKMDEIARL